MKNIILLALTVILAIVVTSANAQVQDGRHLTPEQVKAEFPTLHVGDKRTFVDEQGRQHSYYTFTVPSEKVISVGFGIYRVAHPSIATYYNKYEKGYYIEQTHTLSLSKAEEEMMDKLISEAQDVTIGIELIDGWPQEWKMFF